MDAIDQFKRAYYAYRKYVPAPLLYHPDYFRVLRLLRSDPAAIARVREARLRHVLTVACLHVPYYRDTVRLPPRVLAGERPDVLLREFPYLTKAEVMRNQRAFLDERLSPRFLHYVTSGGSSGEGIGMWRSKRLADIEKAFHVNEWGRFGFTFDKSLYLRIGADAARQAHDTPCRLLGNRLMLSPYHLEMRHRAAILAALNTTRPQFVHAYPSAVAAMAELIGAGDLSFRVQAVFMVSEPATPLQLQAAAQLFGCPVSITYGQSERTNLAFSGYRDGEVLPYRFEALYGITENLLRQGCAEIVGTSLWNDVMPLIRYRTNDFGAVDENGYCATIDGRAQEFLIDRHGNRIAGLSIVIDECTWDIVRLYQVRQSVPGTIRLAVVPRRAPLTAAQALAEAQRRRWGSFFDIEVEEVPDIPLAPNGKRKLVDTAARTMQAV